MSLVRIVITGIALAVGALIGQLLRNFGITIVRPTPVCDDPGGPGCGSNPRQCGQSQVIVFGPGGLAVFKECGPDPATWVTTQDGGVPGLDAATRAQFMFAPTGEVKVSVKHHGSPGRIEAFSPSGAVVDVAMMGPAANVVQVFTLHGSAISRIDVTPGSPADRTVVLGWCH